RKQAWPLVPHERSTFRHPTKTHRRVHASFWSSSLGLPSSFPSRSPHPGNLRQRKHTRGNFGRVAIFDLIDRDRVRDIEPPRFHSSQRIEMGAATEFRADVVRVSSNIKTFAADNGEIDSSQGDPIDGVAVNVD